MFLGCDKKFSRPDSLTTHTKTHSNIRPYICSVEGCPKAYYHARSLKKHELAHESKQGNGVLRGAGAVHGAVHAVHGAVSTSSLDKPGDATLMSTVAQSHRAHYSSHPYHPDYTRQKHRRHLSQSSSGISGPASSLSPPALSPVSAAYTAQPQLVSVLDPSLALGVGPLGTNPTNKGSQNAVPMAGVVTAFGQAVGSFNTALLTPALSTHSSTSSVPTLSMVMGTTTPVATDGGMVMMEPMYQTQGNGLISDAPTQTMTPSGSPGFQPAAPSTILRSPTPTTVPMNMPMSISMTVSGISHPHSTAMLPTMTVPTPMINMAMVQDGASGSNLYVVTNDPHTGINTGIIPSSMDTTLVIQPGADLGYGPMPVDPHHM